MFLRCWVPFDDGGEVEQTLRARALSELPGMTVVPASDLSASVLAEAVQSALDAPPRDVTSIGFDGAARTVELVEAMVRGKP